MMVGGVMMTDTDAKLGRLIIECAKRFTYVQVGVQTNFMKQEQYNIKVTRIHQNRSFTVTEVFRLQDLEQMSDPAVIADLMENRVRTENDLPVRK